MSIIFIGLNEKEETGSPENLIKPKHSKGKK